MTSVELDPQCRTFLDAVAAMNRPSWEVMGPNEARKVFHTLDALFGTFAGEVTARDEQLGGRIPVRMYRTVGRAHEILPVVVYFHGGGFVLGNLDTHDTLCRRLCHQTQCAVVAVDYRLAPEHPFPAALDDCYDVVEYLSVNAQALNVDGQRIIVAGDSAGGNLAAAVSLKCRDLGGPKLVAQFLIYPVLDDSCATISYDRFATGYGLTAETMRWFWQQYAGMQPRNAYLVPAQAHSLRDLPQTVVVTAQCDVLRDEAEAFAQRLQSEGVTTKLKQYEGMIHGFVHFSAAFDKGLQATQEIAADMRCLLLG